MFKVIAFNVIEGPMKHLAGIFKTKAEADAVIHTVKCFRPDATIQLAEFDANGATPAEVVSRVEGA